MVCLGSLFGRFCEVVVVVFGVAFSLLLLYCVVAPNIDLGDPNITQNGARGGPWGGPGRARGYRKTEIGTKRPPRAEKFNPVAPFWPQKSPKELPGGPAGSHLGVIFGVLSRCVFDVFLVAFFIDFGRHSGSILEPFSVKK